MLDNVDKKTAEETQKPVAPTWKVGEMVKNEGVYSGIWTPRDRDKESLGKTFALFAYPHDLRTWYGGRMTALFNDAVVVVANIRNRCGHDGVYMPSDSAIYATIREGREKELEKWHIPTIDALVENLFAYRNTGELAGSFLTSEIDMRFVNDPRGKKTYTAPNYYLSCTEPAPVEPEMAAIGMLFGRVAKDKDCILAYNFCHGWSSREFVYNAGQYGAMNSIRPVRAVLLPLS